MDCYAVADPTAKFTAQGAENIAKMAHAPDEYVCIEAKPGVPYEAQRRFRPNTAFFPDAYALFAIAGERIPCSPPHTYVPC